jgi:hypothetical protein
MNDADWLRKRWKHKFHGCAWIPATFALAGTVAALTHWWA